MATSSDPREKRWNRVLSAPPKVQIESIEVVSSEIFEPQRIEFDRATAIVGNHGAGKTLLLRTVEALFGYTVDVPHPPFIGERRNGWAAKNRIGGEFVVSLVVDGQRVTRAVDLSWPDKRRIEIWKDLFDIPFGPWYTSASHATSELSIFYQDYNPNLGDSGRYTIEEFDRYSREDLNGIRNILGRDYESVVITGIVTRSPDGELEEVDGPHISVVRKGVKTDSMAMSLGEIWVHYVLGWTLARSTIEPVLIDEPESFLAARGHRPLMDEIVRRALRENSQVVVATHSADVLSRFPLSNIRMCVPGANGIRVITPRSIVQVRDSVGIETPTRAILLVEDEFAKAVLSGIFAELDASLGREVEIVAVGGESKVIEAAELLASTVKISVVGVLDGDQRTGDAGLCQPRAGIQYLPGSLAPESELENAAERHIDWLADKLSCEPGDLIAALSICASYDHQYWIKQLSNQLGFNESFVLQMLVRSWMLDDAVGRQAVDLIQRVREVVHVHRGY